MPVELLTCHVRLRTSRQRTPGSSGRLICIPSPERDGNPRSPPLFKSRKTAAGGGSGSTATLSTTRSAAGQSVGERELSVRRMGGLKGGKGAKKSSTVSQSLWLASNPSKRWGEVFFLLYTPFWLTLTIGIVVPYKLYERFTELEYLLIGLVSAVPAFLIPIFVVGEADRGKCWKDRYWVKANIWIIIFSYVGNYFWTHYFFTVLGASYTFPSWRMNNVPHTTFLLTHACFLFYHMTSNITLRRLRHSIAYLPQSIRLVTEAAWILALSYFIAYLETLAISNFPYYEFVDRASMYKVGSLFYAIYFIVSFPMFSRVDEKDGDPWDLPRAAVDALGAAMLVTIILDLWRIFLGPIVAIPESGQCNQPGLAWFHMPESFMQNESS